jgi:hypothetical protein
MGFFKTSKYKVYRPNLKNFFLLWAASALAVWMLICLYMLVFMFPVLKAGLVPWEVILVLALFPIALGALIVQTGWGLLVKSVSPFSEGINIKLVIFGTPVLTCIFMVLLIILAGGPDAFIPRL